METKIEWHSLNDVLPSLGTEVFGIFEDDDGEPHVNICARIDDGEEERWYVLFNRVTSSWHLRPNEGPSHWAPYPEVPQKIQFEKKRQQLNNVIDLDDDPIKEYL